MSMLPRKPITKPGEGKERQKYVSQERYLEERYQISVGLKGPKRLEDESFEDFQVAAIAFGFGATLGFIRRLARIWE